jgi:hypothetical protein
MTNDIIIENSEKIAAFVKQAATGKPDNFVSAISENGTLYRKSKDSWETSMGLGDVEAIAPGISVDRLADLIRQEARQAEKNGVIFGDAGVIEAEAVRQSW